jgi:long-subunit fatty acid transport protein
MVSTLLIAQATMTTALAGGILTNTNQSIDFLRNPARDAAIGLDGVYSNPAGVAFLPEGFYLGINWQYAHQTRTIKSTDNVFALGRKNNGQTTKTFEGVADAPVIPSIQAAWNKGDWSLQFNFSVPGGGGKCEFEDGLGSFERAVGNIAGAFMTLDNFANTINTYAPALYTVAGLPVPSAIPTYGVSGYDMNSYMEGRQYYFGFQLGSAYKVNEKLSVYGGLRLLYGTATYKARISDIQVKTTGGYNSFGTFLPNMLNQATAEAAQAQEMLTILSNIPAAAKTAEMTALETGLQDGAASLKARQKELPALSKYSDGVNLLCNQSSVGIAPVIGIDYRLNDQFNFAAKYEFKTQIRMKNESTVFEASEIEAVNKFRDSEEVNEDSPALLTVGAQWSPINEVRLNLGGHLYFDKQARWYNDSQKKLDHNSYELLAGAEWDVNDKVTISAGGQLTRYGLTDEYMNDISFVADSYSYGFGMNYKLNDVVTMKFAYFQTDYENYNRSTPTIDSFTRTNRVLGIGCDITL